MFAHVMSLPVSRAIVLGLFVSLAAQAATNPLPPPLLDQFGEQRGLDTEPTAEQLVIVVSAKRLRRLKPWERELREHYPELAILRVADVPVSGSADTEAVAAKLRKRLPEDLAVLMDMNGVWAEAFQLDISVPNLLLFNSQLELVVQHAGFFKRSEFNSLRQQLDAVLDVAASEPGHAE